MSLQIIIRKKIFQPNTLVKKMRSFPLIGLGSTGTALLNGMDVFYTVPTDLGSDQTREINSPQTPHRHILPAPLSICSTVCQVEMTMRRRKGERKKKGVLLLLK